MGEKYVLMLFKAFIRGLKAGSIQWPFVMEIKSDGRHFWRRRYQFAVKREAISVGRGDNEIGNGSR
jgi:hypothetical protein